MTQETAGIGLLLDALASEQMSLQAELRDLAPDDWFRPTPSRYWDVRATIAHRADIDEVAIDTCIGGPRPLNDFAARLASPEDTTLWGVLRGAASPVVACSHGGRTPRRASATCSRASTSRCASRGG